MFVVLCCIYVSRMVHSFNTEMNNIEFTWLAETLVERKAYFPRRLLAVRFFLQVESKVEKLAASFVEAPFCG